MTNNQHRTGHGAPTVAVAPNGGSGGGEPGTLRVHVRNVADQSRSFRVQALGLDDGWACEPVVVDDVAPDQTVTAELTITPVAGAAEADYRIAVVVLADGDGRAAAGRTIIETDWKVEQRSAFVLSLEPTEVRTRRSKRVRVVVANSSSAPATAELSAVALGSGVVPKLSRRRVQLGPHESVTVPLGLTVARLRMFHGSTKEAYSVRVTGSHVPAEVRGVMEQRSVITPGMSKGLALVLVLAVWIAGAGIGLPWLSGKIGQDDSVDVVQSEQTQGADGKDGSGGTGGSGSGGSGGGSDDPGAEDSEDAAADPGVRISGALKGDDVSGVQVDVSPASAATGAGGSGPSAAGSLVSALAPAGLLGGGNKSEAKTWRWAVPLQPALRDDGTRSTVTGNDGTWAFSGMGSTTRYLVVLSKAGYQTQRFLVSGAELADTPLKVDLRPGRGSLSGRVTGPAGNVGGATVTITDGSTTLTTRTATTGDVGRWSVDGLSTPGTYLVTAVSDELGAQSDRVTVAASGTGTVDLKLKRGVATLAGSVHGPLLSGGDGGLGGLTVTATNGEITRTATTATGETSAGTFVLPALPVPGTYTVSVVGEGYLTQVQRIKLKPGKSTSRLRFSMKPEASVVRGTVKDVDGTGLTAAGLVLSNDDATYKTMSSSDAEGTFVFNGVAQGDYVLSANLFGYEEALAKVEVGRSDVAVVHLQLPALPEGGLVATSTIRGSTVDAATGAEIDCPDLRAGETCLVTVRTAMRKPDGTTVPLEITHQPSDPFQLPSAGGLYPGRYDLRYTAPGYEEAKVSVAVPMGAVAYAATAALKQLPTIVGSVNTRVGTVPAGTCVIALPGGNATFPTGVNCNNAVDPCVVEVNGTPRAGAFCAVVASNNSYSIRRMDSGTYRVFTLPPAGSEYVPDRIGASVTVVAGEAARRYDPILDRLGRIAVTVLASSGANHIVAAAHAQVKAFRIGGSTTTPVSTAVSETNGYAPLIGLDTGKYRIHAAAAGGGSETGELPSVEVNLNQEIAVPLVMTSRVIDFGAEVIATPSSSQVDHIKDASVRVSGIVGYNGLVPARGSVTLTTATDGTFGVCTSSGCGNGSSIRYLPLVENLVDITVTATNYEEYSASSVPAGSLTRITLQPQAVCFDAEMVFEGASDTEVANLAESVALTVPIAPPGAGDVSVSVGAVTGTTVTLRFNDSKIQGSHGCASGQIRPGTYRIQATLTGYDRGLLPVDLDPGEQMTPTAQLTLSKFGLLRVDAGVLGTIMTIDLRDGTTRRMEADPGATFVDFGALPSGDYAVLVRTAGYKHETFQVPVEAGQTTGGTDVQSVALTKLGLVRGTVTAELESGWDQAVAGATVTVSRGNQEFSTTTDAQGRYSITGTLTSEGLNFGTWEVEVDPPSGYEAVAGSADTAVPDAATPEVTVNLELSAKRGGLELSVLDEDADVVEGLDTRLTYYRGSTMHTVRPVCLPSGSGAVPNPAYTGAVAATECDEAGPAYLFLDVLPLNYTLNVSGQGFASFVAEQSVAAGVVGLRTVQMSAPAGSIQGTVFTQAGSVTQAVGAGVSVQLVGCSLTPASACSTTTNTFGNYQFAGLPPGQYTVRASNTGLESQRVVQLGSAQAMTIDLTLVQQSSTVRVQVQSTNGFDLTGALVTLSNGTTTLGPQPAVHSTGATWEAVFTQVPRTNNWTARVSGPATHIGVHETTNINVNAPTVSPTVTVTETRVRIRAVLGTDWTGYPTSIPVTIGSTAVTVLTDDQAVVHVKSGSSTEVTVPSAVGGWTVTGTGTTVPGSAVNHTTTFTLTRSVGTTLALDDADPATVAAGGTVEFTATLEDEANDPVPGMEVTLQRQTGGTWGTVATVTTDGSGVATFAGVNPGAAAATVNYRAVFAGSSPYSADTSQTREVEVTAGP